MSDHTPIETESMVGFDLDGVAPMDACDPKNDTTIVVFPGRNSDGTPRVLQREASDVSYMAPETVRRRFADRLRDAGYQEPIIPRRCAVDDCDNWTHQITCGRCEEELEALPEDPAPIPWKTVVAWSLAVGVVLGVALFLAMGAK